MKIPVFLLKKMDIISTLILLVSFAFGAWIGWTGKPWWYLLAYMLVGAMLIHFF